MSHVTPFSKENGKDLNTNPFEKVPEDASKEKPPRLLLICEFETVTVNVYDCPGT